MSNLQGDTMKEMTYEDWLKNPTPRMMWVWNSDEQNKQKMMVVYCNKNNIAMAVLPAGEVETFEHCAEIEKTRRMTDEEMAEEYSRSVCAWIEDRDALDEMDIQESFLAGLKAGRPQWHDLRKDPNDLPKYYGVFLDDNGDKILYVGTGKWYVYSEYYEKDVEVEPPKAWCELPKFEK